MGKRITLTNGPAAMLQSCAPDAVAGRHTPHRQAARARFDSPVRPPAGRPAHDRTRGPTRSERASDIPMHTGLMNCTPDRGIASAKLRPETRTNAKKPQFRRAGTTGWSLFVLACCLNLSHTCRRQTRFLAGFRSACSADWQSAVSADWQSANAGPRMTELRVANPRYSRLSICATVRFHFVTRP